MFDNINNNPQKNGSVDDIFAETDKVGGPQSLAEIETKKVGLSSSGEINAGSFYNSQSATSAPDEMASQMINESVVTEKTSHKNYLKPIIFVLIFIFLGLVAYFVYLQFFTPTKIELDSPAPITVQSSENTNNIQNTNNNFVEVIPEEILNQDDNQALDNQIEGGLDAQGDADTEDVTPPLNDQNDANSDFLDFVDSDSDGLSDDEESTLGTNPNLIDSDNDGLNDYEEVKIYLTNPLNPDSDGDGYLDGAEVKSGYDPNAVGAKLPGNQ